MVNQHKRFTLVYTYYNEPHHLQRQMRQWEKHYKTPIDIFLFDDGSQIHPARDVIKDIKLPENIKLSFYEVTKDLGFNGHGCRNLAAQECKTPWLIYLDIDTVLREQDLEKLQDYDLDPKTRYDFFGKLRGSKNRSWQLNKFVISKDMYLESGGYDERTTGWHTGDREYMKRLDEKYKKENLDWTNLDVVRGGRKGRKKEGIDILIYDDENMILYSPPMPKELPPVPTTNFPWKKVF